MNVSRKSRAAAYIAWAGGGVALLLYLVWATSDELSFTRLDPVEHRTITVGHVTSRSANLPKGSASNVSPLSVHAALPTCSIRVATIQDIPIAKATVASISGEGVSVLGLTDTSGTLVLDRSHSVAWTRLSVSARGFISKSVESSEVALLADNWNLTVQLRPAGRISGAIRWADGTSGPSGVGVLAWPRAVGPTPARLRALAVGDVFSPGVLLGTTDEDGSFVIDGADTSIKYSLAAGGAGVLSTIRPVWSHQLREEEIAIPIAAFYAIVIDMTNGAGMPLPRGTAELGTISYVCKDVAARVSSPRTVERALLGVDEGLYANQAKPSNKIFFKYQTVLPQRSVGPIKLTIKRSGYKDKRVSFSVPRSTPDSIPVIEVPLARAAGSFGDLSVQVLGWVEALGAPLLAGRSAATITLRETTTGKRISGGLFVPSNRPIIVPNVPFGEYDVHLRLRGELATLHPRDSETYRVNDSTTGSEPLTFDARHLGRLEIALIDPSGWPVSEPVTIALRHNVDARIISFTVFDSEPYIIGCVPPGPYEVQVNGRWKEADGSYPSVKAVLVAPGDTTDVAVRLP